MPITVKAFNAASGNPSIPATTSVGDLMLLFVGNYSSTITTPSGWTQIITANGTGSYVDYGYAFYRVAQSGDASSAVSISGIQSQYSGAIVVVLTGASTTTPINASNALGGNAGVFGTGAITTTASTQRFVFYTQMSNSSTSGTFGTPSGFTNITGVLGSGAYHAANAYIASAQDSAGTFASVTSSSTQTGGNVGIQLAVNLGNETPVASNLTPNNAALDNRTSPVNLSWTYTDVESNAQNAYELAFRNLDSSTLYAGPATTFNYTGAQQTYVVPAGVTSIRIEAWGAKGGSNLGSSVQSRGGYAKGDLAVTPGETIYIYVGGSPGTTGNYYLGGWNGGGQGSTATGNYGAGGGGASDVRKGGTATTNRVLVAGGGGGHYYNGGSDTEGAGGGVSGNAGSINTGGGGSAVAGATQSTGNSSTGTGGNGQSTYSGGGGGGYYGGYGGSAVYGGGSGGSGYVGGVTNSTNTTASGTNPAAMHGTIKIYELTQWQYLTGTTATSRTFATNYFPNGSEIEWKVRVSDAVAGYGAYSPVATFTSGPARWRYEPIVTSSSANGSFPVSPDAYGTFENSTDITNGTWQSNGSFGAYLGATVARSTTRASTGTYSLEVTCPTTNPPTTPSTWANCLVPVLTNELYIVTVDVWVPTGQSPVEINCVFQDTSSQRSTITNAWQTITAVFTSNSTGAFVGVQTVAPTTSGQKYWIDNFTVRKANLEGGNYELQVATSDGTGFGPWSSIQTFVVNSAPTATSVDLNPKRVGGNSTLSWTYNDANSDTQSKYQIRRRLET